MSDGINLSPGAGGDSIQALQDANGLKWPIGVVVYAETIADGANVLRIVDATHGLPVSVVGTHGVTQSGTWNIGTLTTLTGITNAVTVEQATAASLKCTASQGGTWTVAATQSGTWNVGSLTSISNPVQIIQSSASLLNVTASQGGTWNIGTLTTLTGITNPVVVSQSTAANLQATATLAAGTALIGKASVGPDTSAVYSGTTALTPKFAKIDASASGQTAVVAAVTGKKIRVLRMGYTAAGTVNVKWQSNSTDLTGLETMVAGAKGGGAYCQVGLIETAAGEALNVNLSAAVQVGGVLTYIEV
jgi:hypothetical protein